MSASADRCTCGKVKMKRKQALSLAATMTQKENWPWEAYRCEQSNKWHVGHDTRAVTKRKMFDQ